MIRTQRTAITLLAATTFLLLSETASAQERSAEDLGSAYGGPEVISLATGYERALFDAPVSATIISRQQIEQSGARSLAELLERVPGYYLTSNDARSTQITVRGLTQRVLVLVNNLPLYQGFLNATQTLHDVLLFDVERVEVTRGPGSAIYGADASAGIVNVITRTAGSGPLAEIGALSGNLDSLGAYALYGKPIRDLDLRLYGAYYQTDFSERTLQADAQTRFDQLFRSDASLAPGPINASRRIIDTRASLAREKWALRASHRNEYDFETGTGLTFALDPTGTYDGRVSTLELVHHSNPAPNWSLRGYLAAIDIDQRAKSHPYPAGAFGGLFPQGVRQNFDIAETRYRGELSGTYGGVRGHTLLLTLGGFTSRYDTVVDVRNYVTRGGLVVPTPSFAPGGGVNDPELFGDANRDVWYTVVQDEWTPVSDWTFTLGVRFDDYSDFGSTTNPRAAVVWSPTARTSVKLLYGTAFRPPSIIELQSNGIASALGNPHLNPVRLAMSELSLIHRSASYGASVGVFQYRQQDLVQTVPDINSPTGLLYVNRDSDKAWGAETSVELRATPRLAFEANYTYQTHTGSASDNANAQQAPRHQISLNIDGNLWRDWHVNTFVLGILGRHRATLDPRPDPPDYALVNLALERVNFFSGLDASFALHNLFNRRIDDPSDSAAVLPDDIPVPGRTWFVELRKRF